MTRARDLAEVISGGSLSITGAFTSPGIDDNASATAVTIDAGGSVLIGKSTPTDLHNTWNHLIIGEKGAIISENGSGGIDGISISDNAYIDSDTGGYAYQTTDEASKISQTGGNIIFSNASSGSAGSALSFSERLRLTSDGKLGLGTSSPSAALQVVGSFSNQIKFGTNTSVYTDLSMGTGFTIFDSVGGDSGAFDFRDDGTSRMRIDNSGNVFMSCTSALGNATLHVDAVGSTYVMVGRASSAGGFILWQKDDGTTIGSIDHTSSATRYLTSSDYRLKENISYDFDATSRLKQLKPSRFNFIADKDTTVDGFLAHEVSHDADGNPLVPEAISGEKDGTEKYIDDDGKEQTRPIYQGIDQAKLVPLLTKALQEALTRIDTLEAEVKTLKGE